jgi:hypothetical protein
MYHIENPFSGYIARISADGEYDNQTILVEQFIPADIYFAQLPRFRRYAYSESQFPRPSIYLSIHESLKVFPLGDIVFTLPHKDPLEILEKLVECEKLAD